MQTKDLTMCHLINILQLKDLIKYKSLNENKQMAKRSVKTPT